MKSRRIRRWDEINGVVEINEPVEGSEPEEVTGAGPAISRQPLRGVEDMVEQNDNSFDGVINNVEEKSVIERLKELAPKAEKPKVLQNGFCLERE